MLKYFLGSYQLIFIDMTYHLCFRCVIGSILDCQNILCSHNYYELFRLFVSCRKALKCIIMASSEEKTETTHTPLTSVFFHDSLPALWLFKSVYAAVGIQELLPKDDCSKVDDMVFTLMDHTLYLLLTLNRYQFNHATHSIKYAQNHCKEQDNAEAVHEQKNLVETDPLLNSSDYIEAWRSVSVVPKSLREQMEIFLITLKDTLCNAQVGSDANLLDLNKFSSLVSCFSGFLWGVASVVKEIDMRNSDHKMKLLRSEHKPISEINHCINVFVEFSTLLIYMLLFEDDKFSRSFCVAQNLQKSSCNEEELLLQGMGEESDASWGKQQCDTSGAMAFSASSDIENDSRISGVPWKWSLLKDEDSAGSVLAEDVSSELQSLNMPFLKSLLKGDHPKAAFLVRQLLISFSAILRLNLHINSAPLSSSLVKICTGVSKILLLEFVDMSQLPQPFSFVWLDGVLKFLEELGAHLPSTNPTLSRNTYVNLVELQLRALGKCIALQGKRASLASRETETSTKMLHGNVRLSEASLKCQPYCLDEFKARLRLSFTVFIKKPHELHLLSAIQAIERALVGLRETCTMIYDIHTGSADGGKVSSTVAAGIDCLDLVLEFVSGNILSPHLFVAYLDSYA